METLIAIPVVVVATILLGMVAATETALERASDVRIQALAARGDSRAGRIAVSFEGKPRELLGPLTTARVVFASMIVVTFAVVGAEAYGPVRGAGGMGMVGGLYVAIVQMTVGILAARHPESAALRLAGVAEVTRRFFGLPAFLLGLPARLFARFLGVVPLRLAAYDDILALVEREEAAGGVEEAERRMIRGIIALEDKTAREIMVPRIDIAAVDADEDLATASQIINERGFSRIPVFRETIDEVTGILYAKDLLRALTSGSREAKLADLLRQPVFIPESKRLDQLLTEMRSTRTHLAIVVDEYGGTAGLVTIEDLLEEIVGEIEDEYDVSRPTMEVISEDEVVLDAGAPTGVLRELFDYEVDSEDFDTVGGFVIHELGRLPSVGDEVRVDGLQVRVLSMSGRRVRRLRISRAHEMQPEGASARAS